MCHAPFPLHRRDAAAQAMASMRNAGYVIGGMIEAVESLGISDAERQAVFAGNAREPLKPD